MKDIDIIDIYYDLYSIFGSIEVLAMALKELTGVKVCRSAVIGHLEATRLYHFEVELNALYDTDIRVLRAFRDKHSASLFDYEGDE